MRDFPAFTREQARAFQRLLIDARRIRGMNQTQAALAIGVSQTLISKLERGPSSGMRMDELFRILAYYHIDANQVMQVLGYLDALPPPNGDSLRLQSAVNALYALPDDIIETILLALEWMIRGSGS